MRRIRVRIGDADVVDEAGVVIPVLRGEGDGVAPRLQYARRNGDVQRACVLAGENDQVERVEVLKRELLPRIPASELRIIPETGHLSPLEVPERIATEIRSFLAT